MVAALFAVVMCTGAPAPDVDAWVARGNELRRQGKNQEALEVFEAEYARSKSPRALAQVALAEAALGRWVEAEAHLLAAIATKEPTLVAKATDLSKALETIRRHLGDLEIQSNVDGAEVRVDDKLVGTTPLRAPLRVEGRSTTIVLSKAGYAEKKRTLVVPVGGLASASIDLEPIPAGAPPVATAPAPEPVATPTPRVEQAAPRAGGLGLGFWASAGGAAVAAGGAVALFIVGESEAQKKETCVAMFPATATREELEAACGEPSTAANTNRALGGVATGVGAGLVGLAVWLYLDAGSEEAVALLPGPGDAGIAARVRF